MILEYILMFIVAYLIGGIMPAIILTKKVKGFDVRDKGSNNAGTTNVIRTAGLGLGLFAFILDVAKGVLAIGIAILFGYIFKTDTGIFAMIGAIGVILGHTYPIYFGFKGGKGVATALGALAVINPYLTGIIALYVIVLLIFTRMVSVGSISGALLLPTLMVFMSDKSLDVFNERPIVYIGFSVVLALIILFNHRSNIKRLQRGEESRLTFKDND